MTELQPAPPDHTHLPAPREHRPPSQNPYLVYIGGLDSTESRRTMAGCLRTVARLLDGPWGDDPAACPWEHLRYAHVARLRALFAEQTTTRHGQTAPWSPATINKHLSAVKGVVSTAFALGLMPADHHERIRKVKGAKGTRLPAGRSIAAAELAAMLTACLDGTLSGVRNAAIVAVLFSTGARRAEAAGARREHYDPGARALRIIGKGDKEREVYINEDAAVYLGAWLARTSHLRTGPLLCPIDRWGNVQPRHMTTKAIGDVIDTVRQRADLPPMTAHDFRRTFIGELLDNGTDLATAQALAGHASPITTARYDRRPAAARQAAANRLHLPRPDELGIDL